MANQQTGFFSHGLFYLPVLMDNFLVIPPNNKYVLSFAMEEEPCHIRIL